MKVRTCTPTLSTCSLQVQQFLYFRLDHSWSHIPGLYGTPLCCWIQSNTNNQVFDRWASLQSIIFMNTWHHFTVLLWRDMWRLWSSLLWIKKHCDSRCQDDDQFTLLHIAIKHGHLDIVHFFVPNQNCHWGQYGRASCMIQNRNGEMKWNDETKLERPCPTMPFHALATWQHTINGHKEVVKFLTQMNCDPTCRNAFHPQLYTWLQWKDIIICSSPLIRTVIQTFYIGSRSIWWNSSSCSCCRWSL